MQSVMSYYLVIIISLYLYNQVRGLVTLREKWKASSVTLRFSEGTFTPVIFLSVLPHIHDSGSVDFLTFLSLFFSSFLPPLSSVIILSFRFFSY